MLRQLANLERRTERSGKDRVTHPPSGNDDRINAVAGTLTADVGASAHMVRARGFHGRSEAEKAFEQHRAWDPRADTNRGQFGV